MDRVFDKMFNQLIPLTPGWRRKPRFSKKNFSQAYMSRREGDTPSPRSRSRTPSIERPHSVPPSLDQDLDFGHPTVLLHRLPVTGRTGSRSVSPPSHSGPGHSYNLVSILLFQIYEFWNCIFRIICQFCLPYLEYLIGLIPELAPVQISKFLGRHNHNSNRSQLRFAFQKSFYWIWLKEKFPPIFFLQRTKKPRMASSPAKTDDESDSSPGIGARLRSRSRILVSESESESDTETAPSPAPSQQG